MGSKLNSFSFDKHEVKKLLRISSLIVTVVVLSFVLIFYGVFSAESYITTLICTALLLYILLPITFHFCPLLQQYMVFQPHVDAYGVDFEKPEGLFGVKNFSLTTVHGISIGVWHILPTDVLEGMNEKVGNGCYWEESVRRGNHKGVIVYFHGVTGTRGKPHRVELYKVLQTHQYHVISCDYRGFADSTKVKRITETGVVSDALHVYKWVRNELLRGAENVPVFVWGHSLGTGISTHLVGKLKQETDKFPTGLVLESPFINFAEELRHHSKLKLWNRMPFFDLLFIRPLWKSDIIFQTDGHIQKVAVPIMILHAKNDNVVPSHLGKKLFEASKENRPTEASPVYFLHFETGKHNEIYRENCDIFANVVNSFTSGCLILDKGWHSAISNINLEIFSSHTGTVS